MYFIAKKSVRVSDLGVEGDAFEDGEEDASEEGGPSMSSEDEETWHGSSGKKDDPIALLAGASVSTGLHGGFG